MFEHGGEAVGAGGGEVFLEAYDIDKAEVGIDDVLWGLPVEGADEEGDDALGNDGIAVGGEEELAILMAAAEPDAALAAFDEVALGLVAFVDGGAFLAEFDEVAVFVEPFVEVGELVDDLLFDFGDCHWCFF